MKTLTSQDLAKLPHNKQILFACFCAEQVFHLVQEKDKEVCRKAIDTAYLYLEGKASREDCEVAASATHAAVYAVNAANAAHAAYAANAAHAAAHAAHAAYAAYAANAAHAAYAAVNAAIAANAATYALDKQELIDKQWAFYDELLNTDKYFEEMVLRYKL